MLLLAVYGVGATSLKSGCTGHGGALRQPWSYFEGGMLGRQQDCVFGRVRYLPT